MKKNISILNFKVYLRIVIVGESGVGKTTLFKRFIEELGESNS